ncbi:MAG: cation-translocating P-type ATPase [Candidatus Bathyarchaeia archaeon]
MTVRRIYTDGELIEVTGVGYEPKGEFYTSDEAIDPKGNGSLQLLSRVAVLCSDARLVRRSDESSEVGWYISGDPTEGALVVAAAKAGVLQDEMNKEFPRIGEIPFSSERKRMTTIHPVDGENFAYMKGAPEIVLERCTHILKGGSEEVLTDEERREILTLNERMASDALRILGMAYRKLPKGLKVSEETITEEAVENGFVFVGLMGMIDPPREEAIHANKLCEDAGIKTVMITGDHKLTAVAVAKEIGMMKPDSIVLTGSELENISDEEFERIVEDVAVYARVSPVHKTRIVQALKKRGHIVAMTGDGVNDAPALKNADIGVAMGITGTDVTKEASDMVLADDNFATIVAAVEEGRGIYDNIKKYLIYLLSCNAAEMSIMLIAGLFGWPLPLLTAQLLWVNLTTDGLPALALGVDPADPDIMARQPRDPKESVFTPAFKFYLGLTTVVITAVVLTPFYLIGSAAGWSEYGTMKAQTVAFAIMVFSELARAYTCRSERYPVLKVGMFRNRFLNWAIMSSILMQLAVIQIPALDVMFHTLELSLQEWAMIVPLALTTFVVLELSKVIAPKILKSLR